MDLDLTKVGQIAEQQSEEEDTTRVDISAYSNMTKPEPPTPHKQQIHVLIIGSIEWFDADLGAGLGGLAAAIKIALVGHKVTILEAAPQLAEVCLSHCTR
jgi:heterodisulfide reductase subunit A-like polyferredoxin